MDDYREAERRRRTGLREEVDHPERREPPTVIEFAVAEFHDDGRLTMAWPEGQRAQKATGRRGFSVRRMRE